MATCLPCHNYTLTKVSKYNHSNPPPQRLKVAAQISRDEGRPSSNIVDANLKVLRERIEEIKVKERLERCCGCDYGWNYPPGYNYKLEKEMELRQFYEFLCLSFGTIGLTCFGGTILLCLVSMFTHNYLPTVIN